MFAQLERIFKMRKQEILQKLTATTSIKFQIFQFQNHHVERKTSD